MINLRKCAWHTPTVTVKEQFGVEGTGVDFACKNVNIKMNDGIGKVIYTNTLMGKMVLEDCGLDLRYPLLTRFNVGGTSVGTMEGIDIIDCDVCVNWAEDNHCIQQGPRHSFSIPTPAEQNAEILLSRTMSSGAKRAKRSSTSAQVLG